MTEVLRSLVSGRTLPVAEAEKVMEGMLSGDLPSEQIAALLIAMRMRGETLDEILGFVRVLRRHVTPLNLGGVKAIDTCGTGGDGANTFNISTASALLLAGAKVPVAKHGNRSISSRCGSADVLEALGVPIALDPTQAANCFAQNQFCFLFAPHYHPMLAKMRPVRAALGVPTIFNLLGPLLNPAFVKQQVLGVSHETLLVPFAELLRELGVEQAMVVSSQDGLDEISLCAPTEVAHLKNGEVSRYTVTPEAFGLERCSREDLQGGDAAHNAALILSILTGEEKGAKRNIVLANAAAALQVAGFVETLPEGVKLARKQIDDGNALSVLEKLRRFS